MARFKRLTLFPIVTFFIPPFLKLEAEYLENIKIKREVVVYDFVHHIMKYMYLIPKSFSL